MKQNKTEKNDIPWGRYEVALSVVVAYFVLPFLGNYVQGFFFPELTLAHRLLFYQGLSLLAWVVIFWQIKKRFSCELLSLLGLIPAKPWPIIFKQSALAVGSVFIATLLIAGINSLILPEGTMPPSPYANLSPDVLKTMVFLGLFIAPFLEEIVFRGFIQSSLMKYYHPALALILIAVIFTLLHQLYLDTPMAMASTFIMGTLLGIIRWKSQSLYPSMMAHLFNNLIASLSLA